MLVVDAGSTIFHTHRLKTRQKDKEKMKANKPLLSMPDIS
jgi:hypothetical protein